MVPGPETAPEIVDALRDLAARMGKTPLVVLRRAGFIWNRIQFAVLRERLHTLEAGIADAADIDAAVSDGLARDGQQPASPRPTWAASPPSPSSPGYSSRSSRDAHEV